MKNTRATGMLGFALIWSGQIVSLLGTNMTQFAMTIWIWQQTGAASAVTFVGVSATVATIFAGFIAGPLIDRWDRKRILIVSDLTAGIVTIVLFILYSTGSLQVWHLYVSGAIVSVAGTFQYLAYSAAITILLPKVHYTRASSMNSLAEYSSKIGGPLLAGVLLAPLGLQGIMLIDIMTFLVAITALLFVFIPKPAQKEAPTEAKPSFLSQAGYGFRYIFQRPSLLGLLAIGFSFSLAESLGYPLIAPMILARTGNDEVTLGTVQAFLGVGGVIGAILISVWGGPKRRIHGVLIGLALTGLLGDALMGIGQRVEVWIAAALFLEVFIPLVIGANQSIWQSKVPPDVQGRVFAARGLITNIAIPLSMIFAGLLADKVLEPALMPGGALADSVGKIVGTGAGAGMGVIIALCGVMSAVAGLSGYFMYAVRNVEDILPDHDAVPAAAD